jgi:hypothetical protein
LSQEKAKDSAERYENRGRHAGIEGTPVMIDNINANQVGHIVGKTSVPNPEPANKRAQEDTDVALQVSFADLINKAKDSVPADTNAVEEARELLLSGQLTSPERIRSAIEDILRSGI